MLRREGLYRSHLTNLRKAYQEGALGALVQKKRGRKVKHDPVDKRVQQLER